MTDFNSIPIPPKNIQSIEPVKQDSVKPKPVQDPAIDFQSQLKQALGQIQADADRVSKVESPSFEEMQDIMDQAKNVFSNTMHAHQLMQNLMKSPSSERGDQKGE